MEDCKAHCTGACLCVAYLPASSKKKQKQPECKGVNVAAPKASKQGWTAYTRTAAAVAAAADRSLPNRRLSGPGMPASGG